MSLDLSKLTPAPWVVCRETEEFGTIGMPVVRMDDDDSIVVGHGSDWGPTTDNTETDATFIALARNAFEVLIRRGWGVEKRGGCDPGWMVTDIIGDVFYPPDSDNTAILPSDPFTAIVEADKWLREHVKGEKTAVIRTLGDILRDT